MRWPFGSVRRIGGLACLCVAIVDEAACSQKVTSQPQAHADDAQAPVVASTLPRLRRAWTATKLRTIGWHYQETAPTFDGVLIAWAPGQGGSDLIALELATGKERWRAAAPRGPDAQIEFATGLVLVNGPGVETTALDIKTGNARWTATQCKFSSPPRDNGAVVFVPCEGPPNVRNYPDGTSSRHSTTFLSAFDLATGRELWRQQPWGGYNVEIGAELVWVNTSGKLVGLDPRTGKEAQQLALPAAASRGTWALVGVERGGGRLALVNTGGQGMRTNQIIALAVPDGHEVWSREYPQGRGHFVRGATFHGARLFEQSNQEITEIDPTTGKVLLDCPMPPVNEYAHPPRWQAMRGEVVAMLDARGEGPPVVVRCKPGGAPVLAQVPRPREASFWTPVAVDGGAIVMRVGNDLWGYGVFEADPSEQEALSPAERVRTIVDRATLNPYHTAEFIEANRPIHEELRAVPDFGRHLLALANDADPQRRDRAIDAATGLRIPGVTDLLLGEIFRATPPPGPLTDAELAALAPNLGFHEPSRQYQTRLMRRFAQIRLVAAMDDPRAADRLGPLLAARTTPEGLGWWDANIWAGGGYDTYGAGTWDGPTQRERRAHAQSVSTESAYSESLRATVGRSIAHAAIYRLLARQGRPADLARLDELDRTTARAGGWAAICDADDAVKDPGPQRVWVDPWGLCRGIDVGGGYRLTQARNIFWLRRRLANGSFGPPAWAGDAGGDQCLQKRTMQTAKRKGGRIEVKGGSERVVIATIDPAGVFADSDGDGLTDRTEVAFGLHPKRADSDGDGVPDGRDPAPLAVAPRDARGEIMSEMLRYATLFLVGGPLAVQDDKAAWVDSPSAAGLLLHLPPETKADEQVCNSARAPDEPAGGARTPFPVARLQELKIDGDRAHGRFVWSKLSDRWAHDVVFARVQGKWRVVDDRLILNYR